MMVGSFPVWSRKRWPHDVTNTAVTFPVLSLTTKRQTIWQNFLLHTPSKLGCLHCFQAHACTCTYTHTRTHTHTHIYIYTLIVLGFKKHIFRHPSSPVTAAAEPWPRRGFAQFLGWFCSTKCKKMYEVPR